MMSTSLVQLVRALTLKWLDMGRERVRVKKIVLLMMMNYLKKFLKII